MRRALVLIAVVAFGAIIRAHPASTTTAVVTMRSDGRFDLTITSDAPSLVAKLEALSGAPLTAPPATGRELTERLTALGAALAERVDLRVDGGRTPAEFRSVSVDDRGDATVHLAGATPAAARILTFSASFVYGAYPFVLRRAGEQDVVRWLQGRESSEAIALDRPARAQVAARGIRLGFTHILPRGLDHILFVVGLFLLSTRVRQLLIQVSAFTLAHSITLGLCLYGLVSLPGRIVEPLIALSVAYVGVENLFTSRLQPWRVFVVFAFGLLHGLGFAEALADLHLARADMLSTLVSFNLGVELGQLAVIGMAATALYLALRAEWRPAAVRLASAGVGIMGIVWTIQRVA
jgi:hydrogenase/urease accessory protein HupE